MKILELTEFFLSGFRCRITAHRLATTEQSVVMSCTRSQSVLAIIIFSKSSGPESLKISEGRFQPSKISFCFFENENSEVSLLRMSTGEHNMKASNVSYMKGGSSSRLLRKTAGSGSASHGGNMLPWSFEDRSKMFFSAVGTTRV